MTTGPSSSLAPFIVGSEPNIRFVSIATSGDSLPGDGVLGGIPDGIGAFDNGDGTMTLLVNHELGATAGIVRDHGSIGAYIDRIVIDKATLAVVSADDLIQTVKLWDDASDSYQTGTTAFARFCSGDLAATTAFYNATSGLGTNVRIYLTGEESGTEGRATATIVTGADASMLYELPFLGNMAFENLVANPRAQDKTIVAMTDDGTNGQVYLYVGEKAATGSDIEKAGLAGGAFYGIKVAGAVDETNGSPANGAFTLQEIGPDGNVSNMTGLQIDAESEAEQVTSFLRPEDAAWDPDHPNVLYFTTTNSFTGNTRLYQATFTDITHPELGGYVKAVIDGTEGLDAHMFDNITVAGGKVILQEDPGNQAYVARVWEYDIASDTLSQIANFDPAKFTPGAPGFITQDEESSGVLDVTQSLGDADSRAYLLDAQVHAATGDPATVEQGQLLVMYVDKPFLVGGNGADALFGSAADETLRGNNGVDTAHAGSGNDLLYGGNGNDKLFGDAGNDQLFGDNGDDQLTGGAGDDQLTGWTGADRFIFDNSKDTGFDRILDFADPDRLLTTVKLVDDNNDGIITFGDDKQLDLYGASEVAIKSNGKVVDSLAYMGSAVVDGITYYSYGLVGSDAHGSPAAATIQSVHDFVYMQQWSHDLLI